MPTWYDVDDAASLRRLIGELFSHPAAPATSPRMPGFAAPATRAWLSSALAAGLARRLGIPRHE